MSGNSENLGRTHSEQLSDLESRLHSHAGDEAMLAEMHVAIRTLLAGSGDSAADIEALLEKQFSAGHLRAESYELVKNMLDEIVAQDTASMFATDEMIALSRQDQSAKSDQTFVHTVAPETTVSTDGTAELLALAPHDASATSDASFTDTTVLETGVLHDGPADERLQVGSVLRDRFLLQERVSGGSMGVVYKALDRRLAEVDERNPYVAIKVLSSRLSRNGKALRALQQEAAKGRFLSHRNIVRFMDLDRDDDLYFIVMEWLEGRTLADILDDKRTEKMPLAKALDIVRQLARALDYAHRRGVVHADVKPGNIIVTPSGLVKLFDFGVARVRQKEHEGKSRFEADLMEANTPAYSSMQVLTGEVPVPADDVFSLACLMYRLVADYRVFGPRNAADAAAEGMEPQRPQGLTDIQWRALKKALAYSRVTRFETPTDFIKALDPSADMQPLTDEFVVDDVDDDEPRRFPWRIALALATVFASIAVIMQPNLPGFGDDLTETDPTAVAIVEPEQGPAVTGGDRPLVIVETSRPSETTESAPPPAAAPVLNADADVPVGEVVIEEPVAEVIVALPVVVEETPAGPEPKAAPVVPVIDFSKLPPATVTILLAASSGATSLVLREDAAPAIVDLVRTTAIAEVRTVVLAESGSNSIGPSRGGDLYVLENGGVVTFAAGQDRARFQIAMTSDQSREPDSQVRLQIRDAGAVVGVIELTLEDDEQRAFDARVPANTVGFTETQIFASESDSAVQIDVIRYKADDTVLEVAYLVRDVTATEGVDYFVPELTVIRFGPGQSSARVLVPLTQDAERETDEVFMLELLTETPLSDPDIYQRIAVMIRDDDSG